MSVAAAVNDYAHMSTAWRRGILEAALTLARMRFEADPENNFEYANDASWLHLLLQQSDDAGFARVLRLEVVRDAIDAYVRTARLQEAPPA